MEIITRRRGRPEKLTKELQRSLLNIRDYHPDLTAGDIQGELRRILTDGIKKKHPEWTDKQINGEVAECLPGESTIQKYLKDTKNNPLDKPWSLGSLEYGIPPDLVPLIIALDFGLQGLDQPRLTIREAKWVVRLSGLPGFKDSKRDDLLVWAKFFALCERASRKRGPKASAIEFDSSEFDNGLLQSSLSLEFIKWLAQVPPGWISDETKLGLAKHVEKRFLLFGKEPNCACGWSGIARLSYIVYCRALGERMSHRKLTDKEKKNLESHLGNWITENQDKLETGTGVVPPEVVFREIGITDTEQEGGKNERSHRKKVSQ